MSAVWEDLRRSTGRLLWALWIGLLLLCSTWIGISAVRCHFLTHGWSEHGDCCCECGTSAELPEHYWLLGTGKHPHTAYYQAWHTRQPALAVLADDVTYPSLAHIAALLLLAFVVIVLWRWDDFTLSEREDRRERDLE